MRTRQVLQNWKIGLETLFGWFLCKVNNTKDNNNNKKNDILLHYLVRGNILMTIKKANRLCRHLHAFTGDYKRKNLFSANEKQITCICLAHIWNPDSTVHFDEFCPVFQRHDCESVRGATKWVESLDGFMAWVQHVGLTYTSSNVQ